MIAADTSTWLAYLQGAPGEDVEMLDRALRDRQRVMAPAAITGHPSARKARLGDALIAQSCLDRGIRLITRDRDLRTFAKATGSKLLL